MVQDRVVWRADSPRAAALHRAIYPATLYALLGILDLLFSLVAFSHGVAEGNPVMAWLLAQGWFVPAKIGMTLLVAGLMVTIYLHSQRWRWTAWAGVAVMSGVVLLHLWALPRLVGGA